MPFWCRIFLDGTKTGVKGRHLNALFETLFFRNNSGTKVSDALPYWKAPFHRHIVLNYSGPLSVAVCV